MSHRTAGEQLLNIAYLDALSKLKKEHGARVFNLVGRVETSRLFGDTTIIFKYHSLGVAKISDCNTFKFSHCNIKLWHKGKEVKVQNNVLEGDIFDVLAEFMEQLILAECDLLTALSDSP